VNARREPTRSRLRACESQISTSRFKVNRPKEGVDKGVSSRLNVKKASQRPTTRGVKAARANVEEAKKTADQSLPFVDADTADRRRHFSVLMIVPIDVFLT
jgi:hypothetical protein